jgi:nucleoside-diphosphate-sugar epimerase
MDKKTKIYIAGHKGMVGAAIWRQLEKAGYTHLIGKTSKELDLRNQDSEPKYDVAALCSEMVQCDLELTKRNYNGQFVHAANKIY